MKQISNAQLKSFLIGLGIFAVLQTLFSFVILTDSNVITTPEYLINMLFVALYLGILYLYRELLYTPYLLPLFLSLMIGFGFVYGTIDESISYLILTIAHYRLIGIERVERYEKNIFDSVFLIGIASIINPLNIIFLLNVFFGIIIYKIYSPRYWLIPFLSLGSVYLLYYIYSLLVQVPYGLSFDITAIHLVYWKEYIILFAVWLLISLYTLLFVVSKIQSNTIRKSINVLLFIFLMGIIVEYLMQREHFLALKYLIWPITICLCNILQTIKNEQYRNLLAIIFTFLGLSCSFVSLIL